MSNIQNSYLSPMVQDALSLSQSLCPSWKITAIQADFFFPEAIKLIYCCKTKITCTKKMLCLTRSLCMDPKIFVGPTYMYTGK